MFDVKVYNQDNELVVAFTAKNVATVAPGNMLAQYPALGKFKDTFIVMSTDVYEYTSGQVHCTPK